MWWTLLVIALSAVHAQETCLSGDDNPFLQFATKTPYIFSNNGLPYNRLHHVPGCRPMALWLLNRHGSHLPEAAEMNDLKTLGILKSLIIDNYKHGNYKNNDKKICPADLNLIERWSWNPRHEENHAGELTSDGYLNTQRLAQAWKQRYPELLTNNRHDYLFKFGNDRRSTLTFKAFTEGLFGQAADELDIPRQNDEKLLMPYKFCPAWIRQVGENNDTLTQKIIFESKREFKEMTNNISLRLGFTYDIEFLTVKRMYQMCRYNKGWDVVSISPWCSAFTKEDLQRLEYAEDLETYYKYGYGSDLNQKLGCTLVKDMMDFFSRHVQQPDLIQQPHAMIHLTEGPTLLMALTALEAHRDGAPLTGDNFHNPQIVARKWRTSTMDPYSANIASVLYKCSENDNENQFQVLFLENEKPMYLDDCRVGLCEWGLIQHRYGEIAERCNTEFCNSSTTTHAILLLILSASFIAFVNWLT